MALSSLRRATARAARPAGISSPEVVKPLVALLRSPRGPLPVPATHFLDEDNRAWHELQGKVAPYPARLLRAKHNGQQAREGADEPRQSGHPHDPMGAPLLPPGLL